MFAKFVVTRLNPATGKTEREEWHNPAQAQKRADYFRRVDGQDAQVKISKVINATG